ncbi:MAG: glycosyltransferase family 4 protein [Deltaproteobacteria bacterium]|nr:glycosyltransferase family 4 protein [Deltaproteobacteria bacterium]
MGEVDHRSRTGIYRVIENLLVGLQNNSKVNVIPFSHNQFAEYTLKYMEKDRNQFSVQGFPNHNPGVLKSTLGRLLPRKQDMALLTEKTLTDVVESSDIFHATYLAFPQELDGYKRIKKFITIYDLIPIKFPEYFTDAHVDTFKKTIGSITEDTFVFVISHSTKNDLCNYRKDINPDNVFVTHLAASDLFYPVTDEERKSAVKEKYGIPDGKYILSLATLEPRKNVETTIKAFAELICHEKTIDLNLVLVGTKGWKFDSIFNSIVKERDLANRIIFTGYADDEDLAPLYSSALVFVYPSIYEGFGLPPLEAMQCGLPVISSNTSSLPEVIGDVGILVQPFDSKSICQGILDLLSDERKREMMSQKSIERGKKFSWNKCVQETVDIYNKVK